MNRLQTEMVEVGIDPSLVVLDESAKATNTHHDQSMTAGTEPAAEPEPMVMYDGFI